MAPPRPAPATAAASAPPLALPFIALPAQLQKQLDDAYLLHQLALRPRALLPSGKSLLSLYTRARKRTRAGAGATGAADQASAGEGASASGNGTGVNSAEIERRVRAQVEGAFWDDLARLQQLYLDLAESLAALLPASSPLMQQLREPMSPTSSPLESALFHLAALLHELLRICAPVRDPAIHALLSPITPPPTPRDPELPKVCLATFRGMLLLAAEIKSDLQDARLALMGEKQLRVLIRREAAEEERAVVQAFYAGVDVRAAWEAWVGAAADADTGAGALEGGRAWAARLMQCLGSNRPVQPTVPARFSSPRPDVAEAEEEKHNYLPPLLLLESPALFLAQNTIQALTITACLATLVQPAPAPAPAHTHTHTHTHHASSGTFSGDSSSSGSATSSSGLAAHKEEQLRSFTARVWTLLSGEIAEGGPRSSSSGAARPSEQEEESTKLVHLEEEVRRKRKALHTPRASLDISAHADALASSTANGRAAQGNGPPLPLQREPEFEEPEPDPDAEAERALRKSVSRLLRTEDPVFILLRKRLVQALAAHLALPPLPLPQQAASGSASGPPSAGGTPRTMRTGRALPGRLGLASGAGEEHELELEGEGRKWEGRVRGFEGDVLGEAIARLARELGEVVGWVGE
ncbi:hypothetical protein CALCODRAFT_500156, partial [Calocera cornea HHB12733]